MKKTFKMLNLMLAIITLLTTILPTTMQLSEVLAASYTITWNGKITYRRLNSAEILQ